MCLSRDAIKAHVQRHCDGNKVDREFANDLFCDYRNKSRSKIITAIVDAQIRPPAIKTIVFSKETYVSPEQVLCFDHFEDPEENSESLSIPKNLRDELEFARIVSAQLGFNCTVCVAFFCFSECARTCNCRLPQK